MKGRIAIIFSLLAMGWMVLLLRGAFLQVLPNERLRELKARQFSRTVVVPGQRGSIYDRKGRELAISLTTYSLYADPKVIAEPKLRARQLADLLQLQRPVLEQKLRQKKRRFVWLKRRLNRSTKEKIDALSERGLGFIEESERVYPNDSLAAPLIGFVGGDGQGLEGVEKMMDAHLRGKQKRLVVQRDARGRPLVVEASFVEENADGGDVYLTIDRDIQFALERELAETMEKTKADAAAGVVLDVETSEVVAVVNLPSFNPNRPVSESSVFARKNRAFTDAFEPGSTLKTLTIAAALRAGNLAPNKKYFCENGRFVLDRRVLKEADARHNRGWLSASEILAYSSNIGTAKIALELGPEALYASLKDFGFGQKTGVGFPGEGRGILNALPWRQHLLANVSFGHGIAATPLQIANAYAVLAREGRWSSPRLIQRVANELGHNEKSPAQNSESKAGRQVMSPAQASTMTLMLSTAISGEGTGVNARVMGFPVAGKTGTAQKVSATGRGYIKGEYISSFAGYVPAQSPKFVIYVAVDNPKKVYYGSQVAAPVFAEIAKFALRETQAVPAHVLANNLLSKAENRLDQPDKLGKPPLVRSAQAGDVVPTLRGLTIRETMREVRRQFGGRETPLRFSGRGTVVSTHPAEGVVLPPGAQLEVVLQE